MRVLACACVWEREWERENEREGRETGAERETKSQWEAEGMRNNCFKGERRHELTPPPSHRHTHTLY